MLTTASTILAEQHVHWQEQGRHTLNFQHTGFEGAPQEYEQASRVEVHVAVAPATAMSCAEIWQIMGCSRKTSRANLDVSSSYVIE